jgi:hypothetical protein
MWECFILEDVDRQLEINPQAKILRQTCIPRGKYKIVVTYSNRFKRELPLLVAVPGFSGVRIHPGNTVEDTEGCLLPGSSFAPLGDGLYTVQNSRLAFNKLFSSIQGAVILGESVEIEIL